MITRRLGRTGFEVMPLGMGCYQFTYDEFKVPPEAAEGILEYAMQSEINLFDTAESYGYGESEELVGRARRNHPQKQAVYSTKLGYLLKITTMEVEDIRRSLNWEGFLDPVALKRAVKHSMWLLQMDVLDMLMIHEYNWGMWKMDRKSGDCVALSVLEDLKKEGAIRNIGLGGWDMGFAADVVDTGRIDVVLAAGGMNLLEKPIFDELIPACRRNDTGVILGGAFGQNASFLVKQDRPFVESLLKSDDARYREVGEKIDKLYRLADELEAGMPEMAIRYVMAHEDIHAHVPGARELTHLKSNLDSARKGALPAESVARIDAIQRTGNALSMDEIRAAARAFHSR